jgi:hypothetical protein
MKWQTKLLFCGGVRSTFMTNGNIASLELVNAGIGQITHTLFEVVDSIAEICKERFPKKKNQ